MKKIGLVTIGQSPRVDVTPDLEALWQDQYELVEKGALDGLTVQEIEQLQPTREETVLVSRLRDGSSARLGEERLLPLVQHSILQLQQQAAAIFLLCTGEFPPMESKVPLFEPDRMLRSTVSGFIQPAQKLGVIVPEQDQQEEIKRRWALYISNEVVTDFGTPYGKGDTSLLEAAAHRLKEQEVALIVLDCLGYSQEMKEKVKQITGKPVIIPRTLVARVIAEMI